MARYINCVEKNKLLKPTQTGWPTKSCIKVESSCEGTVKQCVFK